MNIQTKAALFAAAAAFPAIAQAQALPAAVVAIVDRERIVAECTACKVAATQMQTLVTQAQQRQQALAASLQTQGQSLQAEESRIRAMPDGAPKTAAIPPFQARAQAFQQQQASAQQELERLQQNVQSVNANVLRQINEKMNPVVSQVMQQRGANIAMDQDATLATAKTVDITDQVLAGVNTQLTTISVTPMPAQAAAPGAAPAPIRPAPTGR